MSGIICSAVGESPKTTLGAETGGLLGLAGCYLASRFSERSSLKGQGIE